MTNRPLEGIRVLDLTVALAGPYCTLLLAGLGAEVIKIEAPQGGDIARFNPPFYGKDGIHLGALEEGDVSLSILARARAKKSLSLDLKSAEGLRLFKELAKQSDIVVENLSDGTVERLGVDYDSLKGVNPRLIYCSITGMGRPSPYPGLKVMDIVVQALSGVMDTTGDKDGPPTRFGLPIADLLAPLYGVIGIQAALRQREATGQGQHVMTSMLDCLSSLLPFEHFDVFQRMGFPARSGNHQTRLAPFGIFRTSDGHVSIAAANDKWAGLIFEAMGQPQLIEDPRYATRGPRAVNADALNGMIEAWTRNLTTEQVIHALATSRGVPCVKVRTAREAMADPALRESGAIVPLVHPEAGEIDAVGSGIPIRMSGSTVGLDRPAPTLGANNAEVLGLLGLGADEIENLKSQGVI
ncbi:CoA transferase (plasmid) [Paracoccus versutus]|uniref:Formyl-CoA transferase n=1 Tax=Paracoccus versutus TaxID=34007 RepID=A0A3D9XQK4_PARVE|nr:MULTISPECIES: CaiB/BaiF CoA-transferase family protein [Paracoccus]SFY45555.1 formyl-CoA transferase [Paracoccus pantotrophus]KGJ02412.1 formyl-CoA transferase [Paracoccus versutus]MBT0781912.1 CoA transferase [Paracoccus sp. pheM1]REF71981.1 formyl-CoA transferase [Paracoccus versutus]REG26968.1 formyl-CoA transferase [Paracoccus versutus]